MASRFGIGPYREYVFPVCALLASLALPFQWIMYAFVVVGHAHFLMAYRYQQKAGKMNLRYIVVAILLLLASVLYFLLNGSLIPILVAAGVLFAFHFGLDEFTLHNEPCTLQNILHAFGFALLFSGLIAVVAFPSLTFVGPLVGVVLIAGIAVRLIRHRGTPVSPAERYLWFVEAILFLLAVVFEMPEQVLGVVLLLHFANWYMGYAGKVQDVPAKAKEYWTTVVLTLVIPLVLFVLWREGYLPLLGVFFGLASYYAWAIAHIILSFLTSSWRPQP